ncbi:hypothetical protein [Streptomyces sp. NPDC050704]
MKRAALSVLLAVGYVLVTLAGLLVRSVHDPLHRRRDAKASTYWTYIRG